MRAPSSGKASTLSTVNRRRSSGMAIHWVLGVSGGNSASRQARSVCLVRGNQNVATRSKLPRMKRWLAARRPPKPGPRWVVCDTPTACTRRWAFSALPLRQPPTRKSTMHLSHTQDTRSSGKLFQVTGWQSSGSDHKCVQTTFFFERTGRGVTILGLSVDVCKVPRTGLVVPDGSGLPEHPIGVDADSCRLLGAKLSRRL